VLYEVELYVTLVLFDEVLDVLRIDRIFRQPQGHLLLIGVSGSGKTTLSRFMAWMNGLSVFQVKVHNKYTADDFDEDLRGVLRRSDCRVCELFPLLIVSGCRVYELFSLYLLLSVR
jgi:dynein heavy chain 1